MNVRTNTAQVVSARARRAAVASALLAGVLAASPAHSGPNEQARRIYERLAGERRAQRQCILHVQHQRHRDRHRSAEQHDQRAYIERGRQWRSSHG